MKASELLLQSAEPFDKACLMVREMEQEIDRLRAALQLSTNWLRHCSRWNISEETEKAIMTQVIANELLLTHNVEHNRRPQGVRVDGPVGPLSED